MANIYTPAAEQVTAYDEWVASRPDPVRVVAARFRPWILYRLKTSGHRGQVVAIDEQDGDVITVRVAITGEYNALMFDRVVFGINPDDLEECDLPGVGEPLGTLFTPTEVDENIDQIRALAHGMRKTH